MEKRRLKAKQRTSSLVLRKETLRQLEESKLQGVAGEVRMWRPVGSYDENTDPIYSYVDEP
jgi:hypothetical protein